MKSGRTAGAIPRSVFIDSKLLYIVYFYSFYNAHGNSLQTSKTCSFYSTWCLFLYHLIEFNKLNLVCRSWIMHLCHISVEKKALDHPDIQKVEARIAIPWIIPSTNSFTTTSISKLDSVKLLHPSSRDHFMWIFQNLRMWIQGLPRL